MNAKYRIETDHAAGLLDVTLFGFFQLDDMIELRAELLAGIAKLGRPPRTHVSLYDVSDCKIQSQDVVRMFRGMSDAHTVVARRLAVVTGQSLMRMQIPRILVDRDSRSFESREPAIRWLLSNSNEISAGSPLANIGGAPVKPSQSVNSYRFTSSSA